MASGVWWRCSAGRAACGNAAISHSWWIVDLIEEPPTLRNVLRKQRSASSPASSGGQPSCLPFYDVCSGRDPAAGEVLGLWVLVFLPAVSLASLSAQFFIRLPPPLLLRWGKEGGG